MERPGTVASSPPLQSALRWLSERRREEPQKPRMKLIEEAGLRFDLTPLDIDFLVNTWGER